MTQHDFEPDLTTFFIAAGQVGATTAALGLARAFLDRIRRAQPDEDWVVCFDWADSRRVRKTPGGEWQDLGAGLDIAAYAKRRIPESAIQTVDGLEIAFKIPRHVVDRSREKRIDVDPAVAAGVRLY